MDCRKCREQLSAYYDRQLPADTLVSVQRHVRQCADCSAELAEFGRLSKMVRTQTLSTPPAKIWDRIRRELASPVPSARRSAKPLPRTVYWAATAAAVLLAVGLGWTGYRLWHHTRAGGHRVVDLSDYLNMFESDPDRAIEALVVRYDGRPVSWGRVHEHAGYRPEIADHLPDRYRVKKSYVLKMPCCTSIYCTCHSPDGRPLAVLEHDAAQPVTFGDRPTFQADCCGAKCRVTRIGDRLAATWRHDDRYITVVGARDLSEVEALVRDFQRRAPSNKK